MYSSTDANLISLTQSTCHYETLQLKNIGKQIRFVSVANSVLHLQGFEARDAYFRYSIIKSMPMLIIFTQKMIRHFKVGEYLCEVLNKYRTSSSVV
jgi:hypothetical protein